MKVDGKFMFGEDIPEGQASVNELLAECFDLAYELRVAADGDGEEVKKEDESEDVKEEEAQTQK